MNKLKVALLAIVAFAFGNARADEGMWLLQMMKEQHLVDMMKESGLKLEADDLYSPNKVSIKDAIGIFGRGCTGEIISPEGLILTNHHCGYGSIQMLSSVEHDYLTDGFWAKKRGEELPVPGLTFVFVERIVDVTDVVNEKIKKGEISENASFTPQALNKIADELYKKSDLYNKSGISVQLLPFFAGNKFYMFYKKTYSDVRMVAAPPSSVGKFGGETDNWTWPRHTGDFSMFRIYADAKGEPADYDASNKPLQTKKHLAISIKGLEEGDYAMIMGFPGSTSRYLTVSEVEERMEASNEPRITIRGARQDVLKKEMNASDKIRIQYANKYAGSSNYWKNSIGMNKAIIDNDVLGDKAKQEAQFAQFAKEKGNVDYQNVVTKINHVVEQEKPIVYQMTVLVESFFSGVEFISPSFVFQDLRKALEEKNNQSVDSLKSQIRETYEAIHNKDYDHEVDRKVAKVLFPLYKDLIEESLRPDIFKFIEEKYKGDFDKFIDEMYDNSIMASKDNLEKFLSKPSIKALDKDLSLRYSQSVIDKYINLSAAVSTFSDEKDLLHKTYVRGLSEMKLPKPSYPDANFTIRLTYGNVKSYSPKDGVFYNYYTTTKGILEKENPEDREFVVPGKLKELIVNNDYGRYALPNGDMPVCFLTTNDITGGNSGSPVLNAHGELIGTAFDGNWESLSGDINFDDDLQRCINLDVRYILFILEKLGDVGYLIDEMTIVE
ncbi:S46 family peptidase [Bacteroides sp.]|uniref:S46 family peptidase n=1 Tax=Bacteroides sp. TaxID=29523 RepID=UPI00258C6B84|nr:S46 family peptidase [Bacteroides sp.]